MAIFKLKYDTIKIKLPLLPGNKALVSVNPIIIKYRDHKGIRSTPITLDVEESIMNWLHKYNVDYSIYFRFRHTTCTELDYTENRNRDVPAVQIDSVILKIEDQFAIQFKIEFLNLIDLSI